MGKKPVKLPAKTSQTGLGGQPLVSSTVDMQSDDDNEDFEDAIEHMVVTKNGPRPLEPSFSLAKSMGLDSHQMQVMKASFFDDKQDTTSRPTTNITGTLFKPHMMEWNSQSVLKSGPRPSLLSCQQTSIHTQPPSFEESYTDDRSVIPKPMWPQSNTTLLKTQSHTAPVAQPQTLIPKYSLSRIVSLENSLTATGTGLFKDAGHFLSRSFRSGWSLDWSLVHSGHKISPDVFVPVRHGLFNSFHPINHDEESSGKGLEIRVQQEKVDASPWMKTTNEVDKKVSEQIFFPQTLQCTDVHVVHVTSVCACTICNTFLSIVMFFLHI